MVPNICQNPAFCPFLTKKTYRTDFGSIAAWCNVSLNTMLRKRDPGGTENLPESGFRVSLSRAFGSSTLSPKTNGAHTSDITQCTLLHREMARHEHCWMKWYRVSHICHSIQRWIETREYRKHLVIVIIVAPRVSSLFRLQLAWLAH